jgi:Ca-activated chloride channel family protein
MSFDTPFVLWSLAALIPLWLVFMRRRALRVSAFKTMTRAEDFRKLYSRSMNQALLFLLCFSSLIVGLAGPRWGERLVAEYSSGLDIVLAFDVSRSMDLKDGGDGLSRLDTAKQAALSLIESRPDFRYAVCLGKGKGVLGIPLTDDQEAVINLIVSFSSGSLSAAGTNLQDLLEVASRAFPEESPGKRRIILFTDGEDTKGSLAGMERFLQAKGIGVVAVGVGSLQGLPVPQADGKAFLRRADGSPVLSQLREPILQQLADLTGGIYWNASREGNPAPVLAYLDTLASGRSPLEYRREVPSRQVWFIFAALMFFAAARFLEEGLWKKQ